MADDLEEELDYGLDSPDPKPRKAIGGGATATGSGQPTHAANVANAIGADDDIYGDLFAPAAPPAAGHAAVAGAPPPGSIAALEADEVCVWACEREREEARGASLLNSHPSHLLSLSPSSTAPPPGRRPGRRPGGPPS